LTAGDDDEMFMTRSLSVTPKTTEQHLIARSDKSVAYATTIKDCVRRFVLLKLTTDRHEASRGLFATAELLVLHLIWETSYIRYTDLWSDLHCGPKNFNRR